MQVVPLITIVTGAIWAMVGLMGALSPYSDALFNYDWVVRGGKSTVSTGDSSLVPAPGSCGGVNSSDAVARSSLCINQSPHACRDDGSLMEHIPSGSIPLTLTAGSCYSLL